MIRENAACKLYFDLEFSRILNQGLNGYHLTERFIKFICIKLKSLLNVNATPEDVLVLDSTTENKYSAHLIFNLKQIGFRNNSICKSFVNASLIDLNIASEFSVKVSDDKMAPFCDMQVYTKNRNFRMFMNTKYGKQRDFVVSQIDRYIHTHQLSTNKEIFHHALVCLFDTTQMKLICEQHLPTNTTKLCTQFNNLNINSMAKVTETDLNVIFNAPTPFTDLDEFISAKIAPQGGKVAKVSHKRQSKILFYYFHNYRYCKNRGRSHKSQNVYFYIDLSKCAFAQKCFDIVDCYGYISEFEAIPQIVTERTLQILQSTIDNPFFLKNNKK